MSVDNTHFYLNERGVDLKSERLTRHKLLKFLTVYCIIV